MSRYLMISRLRWPAILLLTGIIALLDQADILSWGRAWPLYLILFGVLALAERASLSSEPPPDYPPYGANYQGAGYAPAAGGYAAPNYSAPPASPPAAGTGIVPVQSGQLEVRSTELGINREEEDR